MRMKETRQGHLCVEELEKRYLLTGEWLKFAPAVGFKVTEPGADPSSGTHKAGPIANGRYTLGLYPDPPRPIAEPTDPEKQVLQKWYPAPAWKFVYATPLDRILAPGSLVVKGYDATYLPQYTPERVGANIWVQYNVLGHNPTPSYVHWIQFVWASQDGYADWPGRPKWGRLGTVLETA